jgi:hypothetical protein
MAKNNKSQEKTEKHLLVELNNKLNGILVALALKEKERKDKVKILSTGGFNQPEIIDLIGESESAKYVRKHREKRKND